LSIDNLIVGLGNPGSKYFSTRHNIGFIIVDVLAEFFKIESFTLENNYLYAETQYKDKQVVLMKPLTYMNASGSAVKEFYGKYEASHANTLIIYDDINLDFGVLRLRPSGSDGGQNGIKSVIYELETEDIPRLRIGIRNEAEIERSMAKEEFNLAQYVLSNFAEEELKNFDKVIEASRDAVLSVIEHGIKHSMNKHNKRVLEADSSAADSSSGKQDLLGENNN
jgi:PTH1 family peptidyl-tRNA hydrolase